MARHRRHWPVLLLMLLPLACAGVDYEPAPAKIEPGTDVGGFVYYESCPYLLVHSDGKGSVNWRILSLPDQTQKRVAKPHNLVASLNTSFTFDKGMLTDAKESADETAVLKAVAGAVQTALPLLLFANAPGQEPTVPAINLFKITVTGDTVTFTPAGGAQPIKVPLQQ